MPTDHARGGAAVLRIRPFEKTDQRAARELIESGLGDHFGFVDRDANPDLVDIDASYPAQGHAFFVAELDGRVVGTTGLLFEPPRARLVRVSVSRAHRRSGVASRLLCHCVQRARQRQVSILIAYTQPEWPDACGFYLHHGFQIYGRDSIDIHLRRLIGAD